MPELWILQARHLQKGQKDTIKNFEKLPASEDYYFSVQEMTVIPQRTSKIPKDLV